MIKRKFGMKTLNITQGRFNGFSHANLNAYDLAGEDTGIDRWITYNELEVIGIFPYSNTGFANTVLFYDNENDVTLAMSHCNFIPSICSLGKVIPVGRTIYYEGTAGKATGNHIHLELGRGRQTSKVKINSSEWGLKNWINIEDYFYLDDEITIKNSPYLFSKGGDQMIELNEGINNITYKNHKYIIVKQPSNSDVGIWSLKHPSLYPLTAYTNEGKPALYAKNLSFFEMSTGYVLGSEISDIYDEAVPTAQGYIDVVKLKDGTWKYGNFGPYVYRKEDVDLRYSTGMVLVSGGVYSNEYSQGCGEAIRSYSGKISCLFIDWCNIAYMVVSEDNVSTDEMRQLALDLNMQYAFRDDSGGSCCITKEGKAINNYSGRKLPNCLVFVEKAIEEPVKEDYEKLYNTLLTQFNELSISHDKLVEDNSIMREDLYKANEKLNKIKAVLGE